MEPVTVQLEQVIQNVMVLLLLLLLLLLLRTKLCKWGLKISCLYAFIKQFQATLQAAVGWCPIPNMKTQGSFPIQVTSYR